MKSRKIISLVLSVFILISAALPVSALIPRTEGTALDKVSEKNVSDFTDVPSDAYYRDDLASLVAAGGINGTSDTTFSPDETITVAQYIKIITAVMYGDSVAEYNGYDLGGGLKDWRSPYIGSAVAAKIIGPVDISPEKLDTGISRYDMSVILVLAARAYGEELTFSGDTAARISDFASIPETYKDYVLAAYENKLLNGKDESGLFDGAATLTRAEAVATVVRLFDKTARDKKSAALVTNGVCNYTIVYPERNTEYMQPCATANSLAEAIKAATGATVKVREESYNGNDYDPYAKEIIVGLTSYPESEKAYEGLMYGSWKIEISGNKILVCAYCDQALTKAADTLGNIVAKAAASDKNNVTLDGFGGESGKYDVLLDKLPVYSGGKFLTVYNAGDNNREIIIKITSRAEYDAYIELLKSSGFEVYASNEINKNRFTTLKTRLLTVSAGFYDYEDTARIIVEPLAKDVGLKSDDVYTKVCTPLITMLGLDYADANGTRHQNGLSLLIRLEDGRFVVVDGGFNYYKCADSLISVMREQSKAYAKNENDITIAAWIITHAHGDHSGMIAGQYAKFKSFRVERFIVNFIAQEELKKAKASKIYTANYSSGEGDGYSGVVTAAKALGADLMKVHVGQTFYLGGAEFNILFTAESYAPQLLNAFNTTSLVIKCAIGGQTLMINGDTTGPALTICSKMYREYLKSDIAQISHHGYTTWGMTGGTILAYRYMAPSVILWDQGNSDFLKYVTKDYNQALVTSGNVKEIYLAGDIGHNSVLEIPYAAKNTGEEHDRAVSSGAK